MKTNIKVKGNPKFATEIIAREARKLISLAGSPGMSSSTEKCVKEETAVARRLEQVQELKTIYRNTAWME